MLVGYLAGVAAIMVSGQLGRVTGVRVEGDSFIEEARSFATHIGQLHGPTLAMSAATLIILLVASHRFRRAPVPLFALVVATVVAVAFSLDDHGVRMIGDVPTGLPAPSLPDVNVADIRDLLLPAIGVAIVAYSDNVLVGRGFAMRNGYRIDPNQELVALGGANVAAGLLQGFPVSSSATRTVIGDAMGSRTQLYSLVALAAVIPTVLFLSPSWRAFQRRRSARSSSMPRCVSLTWLSSVASDASDGASWCWPWRPRRVC